MVRNDSGVRMRETFAKILAQPASNIRTIMITKYRQNIDIMRALHNAFGYGTYKTDKQGFCAGV